ncbi:hypothetical protein [Cohnella kolymensis]|uniref:hypothetical protein n=1 Tax=Cohnella kolymensis TaxID=1590652 RepID=UPI00069893FF|nr:hypothetical protein [Cohnella kolymensis]
MNLDQYISEIDRYKELAVELQEDNPAALLRKIEILTKCLVLIGDLSSECDRLYKRMHVHRDTEYAKAYIKADRPKKENAELAITKIRQMEAESYGRMQKWRNEFDSMTETLHGLRLKMKVNFAEGSINYTR